VIEFHQRPGPTDVRQAKSSAGGHEFRLFSSDLGHQLAGLLIPLDSRSRLSAFSDQVAKMLVAFSGAKGVVRDVWKLGRNFVRSSKARRCSTSASANFF
jgi:hypothetical protein